MTYLNKLGLFCLLVGLQEFPPSNDLHGVFMFLIMMGGAAMFLYTPETHLTQRAADERESARSKSNNKQSSPAWWCMFPAHR